MAAIDPPRSDAFRIDMLWNDSRYRSGFIQVVALLITVTLVWLVVNNVLANLAALGKEFGFSFMTQPAGYDINQRPIEYDSRDSHARAAVVGIMNTLLVAVVGCFLATIIGVLAGIARLSKNWMLRTLMSVYVEGVRNIPVLIQILLLAAVFDEVLPAPRDFRGEDAVASMMLFETVAATNRGFYFPLPVWGDGSMFVVIAFVLAVVGAIVYGRYARARQAATGEILPVFPVKLGMMVGAPFLVFLIMGLPIGLEYPELRGFNFQGGLYVRNSFMALTLALAIYTGAFIAENVRAGIQAVSKGQTEASFALGLQPGQNMSLVVLPQALRIIIPPLISQYLNLTKNSSLALLVGYMDVTGTLMGISLNQTGREFETLGLGMAVYLTISLSIAAIMNLYNENSKLVERTSTYGAGLSVRGFVDGFSGPWEKINKGDALMRPNYGIRLELNLYWLFYGLWLLALLSYVFIEGASETRPSYWEWGMGTKIAALGMMAVSFAALMTCLFKNARFIDFVALEFLVFVFAVLLGFPFSALVPGVPGTVLVVLTAAMRLGIFGYTMMAPRPNITFFHRVPKEG